MVKASPLQAPYLDSSQSPAARAQDLIERMTLDEKLAQLGSRWFNELQVNQQVSEDKLNEFLGQGIGQVSRVGGSSILPPPEVARAGNQIQRFLLEETRLKIPAILHEESCSGLMSLGSTIFPQMIGLASTWQPELAERMTTEIRRQMLAVGARQALGPVLDLGIDPRWGRIEETFGEDPLLASQFGLAYVRGLQGAEIQAGVMATGKHFVGHSLSIGGQNCGPVHLGPQALWDMHLLPFQAAIQAADLRSVMNAYPELDGEVIAASRAMLTELLREQLGFDGLVVSDYEAIEMIHNYHYLAPDLAGAAAKALWAGIDIELPTIEGYGDPLRAALEAGAVTLEDVDRALGRVLHSKLDLGLFENPYVDEGRVPELFETQAQRDLAREIARQSMVLLKNDGLLPLKAEGRIALIGPNADAPRHMLGDYSYPATFELMTRAPMPGSAFIEGVSQEQLDEHAVEVPSILEGIRDYVGSNAELLYAPGCPVLEPDRSGFAEAVSVAEQADVVILVLGDKSGLVPSCTTGETRDRAELGLPGVQAELVQAIIATGKPVVTLLVNGRPLAIPWMAEQIPAILEAWLPGEEGAAAVAEVLFGEHNPGGKLPVTVPRSVGQLPINYHHKASGGRSHWYVDYVDESAQPLYPFGHGLSYTEFEYSGLQLSAQTVQAGEELEISFSVSNRGQVAGDEVAQLYVSDVYASRPRPAKELKAFQRLHLAPGESRRVRFSLPVDILAFHDDALHLVVEAGEVRVMIGSSSADIRLEGSFQIGGPEQSLVAQRIFETQSSIE